VTWARFLWCIVVSLLMWLALIAIALSVVVA
jgi:hypothetical protein